MKRGALSHRVAPAARTILRAALAVVLGTPAVAWAYSEVSVFDRDPSIDASGGGGGISFTGSPRQHGLSCESCHLGGPTDIGLRLSSLLPDGSPGRLFEEGVLPGVVYQIEVAFDGDRLAPPEGCQDRDFEPCDLNLFAAEVTDGAGAAAGIFCPVHLHDDPPELSCAQCPTLRASGSRVVDGCRVIYGDGFNPIDSRFRNGVTATSFYWRAPREAKGPLTFHISAVDGRGQETPEGEATSYWNDGTTTLAVPLGGGGERSRGCGQGLFGVLLLPGVLAFRARRRA